jgi:HD-GYP domain-containing protein (c-di-GMP phosphodiesterase class II)
MPNTMTHGLTCLQRRDLDRFGSRIGRFGVNFTVVDTEGQIVLRHNAGRFDSDPQAVVDAGCAVCRAVCERAETRDTDRVWRFCDGHVLLAAPLCLPCNDPGCVRLAGVMVVDLGEETPPAGRDALDATCLSELIRLEAQNVHDAVQNDEQMEKMGVELAQVYEELVLLHKINTNMKVTESDGTFLQLACDSLTDIVPVEGIAIVLERTVEGERRFMVAAGSGLIDLPPRMTALLHSRLTEEIHRGQEALLDSEVDSAFRYDWPASIRNIIAVPLCAKGPQKARPTGRSHNAVTIMGYMVAVNRIEKPDFDSTDMKLFASVASGCAVFIENGRLFNDLKELFVGSLRALTNSIDAKDQYTRGHSERVAIISQWLAERVGEREPLDHEQIHRIYLAGLLHDIGKIGVDENVLRKNGRLTSEERERIQRHPSIGAGILRGIKQMCDIVPGVLHHHERVDGRGYPEGLVGDEIPLTAKIVGLADSFDAMTSRRVYRDAMTVDQALDEIRKGLGTQFDARVGTIFLESDIYHLWDLIQGNSSSIYSGGHFADYGTAAVGTLLR